MLLNRGKPQQNTSNQRQEGPNVSKRLSEFESRQKIFEDEIIKRIKEIQRYTKSIHLQVKKQQTAQQEVEEHQDRFETQLVGIRAQVNMQEPNASDVQAQIDEIRE